VFLESALASPRTLPEGEAVKAGAAVGSNQGNLFETECSLEEPGATIQFRITRLYGKAIKWLETGERQRGSQLLLAHSQEQQR
jgi:hypothetical protein